MGPFGSGVAFVSGVPKLRASRAQGDAVGGRPAAGCSEGVVAGWVSRCGASRRCFQPER